MRPNHQLGADQRSPREVDAHALTSGVDDGHGLAGECALQDCGSGGLEGGGGEEDGSERAARGTQRCGSAGRGVLILLLHVHP
jgi:hypothetical protein